MLEKYCLYFDKIERRNASFVIMLIIINYFDSFIIIMLTKSYCKIEPWKISLGFDLVSLNFVLFQRLSLNFDLKFLNKYTILLAVRPLIDCNTHLEPLQN